MSSEPPFPRLLQSQPKKVKNKRWTCFFLLPFWRWRGKPKATSRKHGWPFPMHGPPWCLLLCQLFHWHEKWAELARWSLQAGSWYESGPWMYFCSFWWLTRKLRREKRTGMPTLPLNYLTKSSEDAGEHQRGNPSLSPPSSSSWPHKGG